METTERMRLSLEFIEMSRREDSFLFAVIVGGIIMGNEVVPFSEAYQKNRLTLREVVPLDVPLCICIEPTHVCNF